MKIAFSLFVMFAIIIIIFLTIIYRGIPEYNPEYKKIEIHSDNLDESVFIKKKMWGVTGDHQVRVVTRASEIEFEPDSNRDYIYLGLSPFFYEFKNDTLKLYVAKVSPLPSHSVFEIAIIQTVLSNSEMMKLMDNYSEKGIEKF